MAQGPDSIGVPLKGISASTACLRSYTAISKNCPNVFLGFGLKTCLGFCCLIELPTCFPSVRSFAVLAARLVDQAAQKSRFRCFVLASLRTSREALLYIWGVPMFVMFINYKHYNHWHTPNVK